MSLGSMVWAKALFGEGASNFGGIPVGGLFKFPPSDRLPRFNDVVLRKVSSRSYVVVDGPGPRGVKFKTGLGSAVFPVTGGNS